MKKKIFAILFVFITSFLVAQDCNFENAKELFLENENDYNQLSEILETDSYFYGLFQCFSYADGEKNEYYFLYEINKAYKKSVQYDFVFKNTLYRGSLNNYCKKIKDFDFVVADFTFDEQEDILRLVCTSDLGDNVFEINHKGKKYFKLASPQLSSNNNFNIKLNIDGLYKSFNDLNFCIINGKRGVKIHIYGRLNYLSNDNTYLTDLKKDASSNYFFFYWSPSSQCYILDETVTQEQLANAYCPEDYFAYNGLKFSKLDSKLTEADLKDLDKAQLRLMRNAVYARHGRTFKSVDLQSLWECYTWYKKNPNYSDSLLTDIDKYNIELIQKYEAK